MEKEINEVTATEEAITDAVNVSKEPEEAAGITENGNNKKQLKLNKTNRRLKRYKKKARRRFFTIIFLVLLLSLSIFYSPLIGKYVGALKEGEPLREVTEDILGRKTIKIKSAILGQTREEQELIVMEQDVEVTSEISSSLANLSVFSKTKIIYSYGTGVYTVDMSELNEKSISVDERNKIVYLTIPHTSLKYVNLNIDKTKFEETQKGLLAFGDIKLTQEQQQLLSEEIEGSMRDSLATIDQLKKADELALLKVWEVFNPSVKAVSAKYTLTVIFQKEEN